MHFFPRILWIESSKEQHLLKTEIFCNTINVFFTDNSDEHGDRTMTWRDQIEARTKAANILAVWKHLKLSEKDRNHKHRQRETG